jgi:hypothetical protein
MTLEGCLVREQDVPGRQPNIVERAGILEDFILTDAKPASGSSSGAVGTAGSANQRVRSMYKIEGIDDERLESMLGKRVQVTGRIDDGEARDRRPAGTTGTPSRPANDEDIPEFEATSIREASGSGACPPASANPSNR